LLKIPPLTGVWEKAVGPDSPNNPTQRRVVIRLKRGWLKTGRLVDFIVRKTNLRSICLNSRFYFRDATTPWRSRLWIPELSPLPDALIHQPWELSSIEMLMFGFEPGLTYPHPVVDPKAKKKPMVDHLWKTRKSEEARSEKKRILETFAKPRKGPNGPPTTKVLPFE
jgi:hypothetical protein